jgi:hypothetical protein
MDNARYGIRASGDYAHYRGGEYFASRFWDRVWLYSDDDPLPPDFVPSKLNWIKGEKLVPIAELDSLQKVHTTCTWRGHPFEVGVIIGDFANISYMGKDFDAVSTLPGMQRPDKYEVKGRAPVSELGDLHEEAFDVPLVGKDAQERNGDQR